MKNMSTSNLLNEEIIYEALKDVYDPEIPVNIVDLGLVYGVEIKDNDVKVNMTLTFAGCGMGPYIAQQAEWRIVEIEEVEGVGVEIAKSIKNYFITEKNLMIIQNMFNNGVLIKSENKNSLKLAGKTFCITGTFNNFSRDYLKDKINKESGKVTSSVSKRTDFLS